MQSDMVNETKLNEFIGKVVTDMGGGLGALLAYVGDRLGLYKAIAGEEPMSAEAIAQKTNTNPRMIKEWLASQVAGGYIIYDPKTETYTLPAEHAIALAQEGSPAFMQGGFQILVSLFKDEEKIIEAMRTGKGLSWGDHDKCLFEGTERFFRPLYIANLTANWIPSLNGVEAKLMSGAKMADIGCGHGASAILLAKAYPNSKFIGYDSHEPSIEWAKKYAKKEGVADRVSFQVAKSTDYPGSEDYDVIAFFDCLHDMSDPLGALAHSHKALKRDGTLMIIEPYAEDMLERNITPLGRLFYSASTTVCVPASLSQGGPGLGAQAGEKKIRDLVEKSGFSKFSKVTQSPVNAVYEARP